MKMTKTDIAARLAVALPADTPAATVAIVAKLMREASAPDVTEKRVPTHNEWLQANPVSSTRGAPLGRRDDDMDPTAKVHIERLDWIDGDYDRSGVYWGQSRAAGDIYAIWQDLDGERRACYRRAKSRDAAVQMAIEEGFVPLRGSN